MQGIRLIPCQARRGVGAALVATVIAIPVAAVRKPFAAKGLSRSSIFQSSLAGNSFPTMLSMATMRISEGETESPVSNVKVLDSAHLTNYYEDVKRILFSQGNLGIQSSVNGNRPSTADAFSLRHFEPRHRKSMMRCVLNGFPSGSRSEAKSMILSKADFQERLRLVDRRQRWEMTRELLFGDYSFHSSNSSSNNGQQQQLQQHWWESGIIGEEKAPGLAEAIRNYRDSWKNTSDDATVASQNDVDETKVDPKKFLSRLARGRVYKGKFRNLLQDYVTTVATATSTVNEEYDDRLIPLLDKITGGEGTAKPSCDESNQHELQLLRLFIQELEGEATTEPSILGVVSPEQISLLRNICDLDIFFSLPPTSQSSSSGRPSSFDDDGRTVGKRGERDLKTFLMEEHQQQREGGTKIVSVSSSGPCANTRVLSPVWVRPKSKNRRNIKQKCRYVLEIPRMADSKDTTSTPNASYGITSEFDAMVVRVIGEEVYEHECQERYPLQLPIMAIQEVWDAKATLDPSALMNVLEKKVRSLQRILCDENSRVVNISDPSWVEESTATTSAVVPDAKADMDGANFVVLPPTGNTNAIPSTTDSTTVCPPLPLLYRVGVEPARNTNRGCEFPNGSYPHQMTPQIGVFASRMISPGAAARRIQTIVYEGMLESDLSTVKGVIRKHQRVLKEDTDSEDVDPLRCNLLVRDRSIEIVERILHLIETLRPVVVVGTLPSKD